MRMSAQLCTHWQQLAMLGGARRSASDGGALLGLAGMHACLATSWNSVLPLQVTGRGHPALQWLEWSSGAAWAAHVEGAQSASKTFSADQVCVGGTTSHPARLTLRVLPLGLSPPVAHMLPVARALRSERSTGI